MKLTHSTVLFNRAEQVIPGGVNSPVRAFRSVGGTPRFIQQGQGAYLIDVDGQRYIDYIGSWGALILGHCHPEIVKPVQEAVAIGMTYGAPTELEVELAEKICQIVPSIDMVRMCSSGTEATMTAIRLARGFTDRTGILKFEGCYHGHSDALLAKAGSGLLTLGIPGCPGVPEEVVKQTFTLPFNTPELLTEFFQERGHQLACVILEPIACNMNLIIPSQEFMQQLRTLCDHYGVLLIYDEVITGFRIGLTGAQGYFNITPDLTTYGKIIGGGFPVGAYGGRREIMKHMAPIGSIYQAGTLSGNPMAMTAGLATLSLLETPDFYQRLQAKTEFLVKGMNQLAHQFEIPLQMKSIASIFGLFFTSQTEINHYDAVAKCNIDQFKAFFHGMLEQGVYLAPSAFEAGFISLAHTETELEYTLTAAKNVFENFNARFS